MEVSRLVFFFSRQGHFSKIKNKMTNVLFDIAYLNLVIGVDQFCWGMGDITLLFHVNRSFFTDIYLKHFLLSNNMFSVICLEGEGWTQYMSCNIMALGISFLIFSAWTFSFHFYASKAFSFIFCISFCVCV